MNTKWRISVIDHRSETTDLALASICLYFSIVSNSSAFYLVQEFLDRDGEDAERPKGLWGALLRKLTVKHQSEQQSMLFEPKEDYHITNEAQNLPKLANHDADITNAMISLLKSSPSHQPTEKINNNRATLAEGRHCGGEAPCTSLPGWPGGIQLGGMASNYWPKDNTTTVEPNSQINDAATIWKTERRVEDGVQVDYPHSMEKRYFPKPLSDVDEISETESVDSPTQSTTFPLLERKELHRHKKRVSIKVAGFVGWKKSSKKGDSKLQDATTHVE